MSAPFQATAPNGRALRLTNRVWKHVCTVHPELRGELEKVNQTMMSPDLIKQDNRADTFVFYKFFTKTIVSPKYLVLVIKYLNAEGLLSTGYFTGRIRKGEILWKRR